MALEEEAKPRRRKREIFLYCCLLSLESCLRDRTPQMEFFPKCAEESPSWLRRRHHHQQQQRRPHRCEILIRSCIGVPAYKRPFFPPPRRVHCATRAPRFPSGPSRSISRARRGIRETRKVGVPVKTAWKVSNRPSFLICHIRDFLFFFTH